MKRGIKSNNSFQNEPSIQSGIYDVQDTRNGVPWHGVIYWNDMIYKKFFKGHAGYPKFKSKHNNHKAYTTNFTNGNIAVDFENGKIKLPQVKKGKSKAT